ncbi:MAG: hypothetical protein Q7T20_18925, partial [Saprospiraceae bacterium]|nr:hypothetical protein [Saprospiraceae bacterium]
MIRTTASPTVVKFDDFPYSRPDMAEVSLAFEKHLSRFANAADAERQQEALTDILAVREEF